MYICNYGWRNPIYVQSTCPISSSTILVKQSQENHWKVSQDLIQLLYIWKPFISSFLHLLLSVYSLVIKSVLKIWVVLTQTAIRVFPFSLQVCDGTECRWSVQLYLWSVRCYSLPHRHAGFLGLVELFLISGNDKWSGCECLCHFSIIRLRWRAWCFHCIYTCQWECRREEWCTLYVVATRLYCKQSGFIQNNSCSLYETLE